MTDPKLPEGWSLTRNISLPTMITIALQTVALAFFIGTLNNKVEVNTRDITRLNNISERMARVETQLEGIRDSMRRVEQAVGAGK